MTAVAAAIAGLIVVLVLVPWAGRRVDVEAHGSSDRRAAGPHREPTGARPIDPVTLWVAIAVLVAVGAVVARLPAALVLALPVTVLVVRARIIARRRRGIERAVERAAPDLVDLLGLSAAAGHPAHRCLHVVADRAPPSVRGALRATCRRLDRGAPLAVAVDELRRGLGSLGDPVADALVDAFRSGAPLQPALGRVAAVARDRRRRNAEAEARRLPVLLLFPLVCCVLPAFGLLAVVPLVVASLRSLG